MEHNYLSPKQKALQINLNPTIYGSFAEIGAGQEVARNFFQAGGASGTIAKTISAYDMTFSDSIYGKTASGRYVSELRLMKMLDIEYRNVIDLLETNSENQVRFFAFANTISALNFSKTNYSHGWIGIRFQNEANSDPNEVILHVEMHENDNILQQQSLGILGVNLIYACYHYWQNPNVFLKSLLDDLSPDRIEINAIRMSGPQLKYVDNRLLSVQLVKNGMTDATIFDAKGRVQMPADLLYKKNVMALRGSFRPITYVGFDMLKTGFSLLKNDVEYTKENTIVLCEMTLNNLCGNGEMDDKEFLDRAELLCGMGQNVMISGFKEYYRLVDYFNRFQLKQLRLVTSSATLKNIINQEYYQHLKGGILEAFGHLFTGNTKLYIYPSLQKDNTLLNSENIEIDEDIKHLYKHLKTNNKIIDITSANQSKLNIYSHDIIEKIQSNDSTWEEMLPIYIAEQIKTKKLFGYENLEDKKEKRKIACKKHQ